MIVLSNCRIEGQSTTTRIRGTTAAALASLVLLGHAAVTETPPAKSSVGIGQLAPGSPPSATCNSFQYDLLQPAVLTGNAYSVPVMGRITSWSTNASANLGQMPALKVFRRLEAPDRFVVVAHDGPRSLTPSAINTFETSLKVEAGDVIGLNTGAGVPNACLFFGLSETNFYRSGDLADGTSATFETSGGLLNVAAEVEPSNQFKLLGVRRNPRRGTAILALEVPGPGTVALTDARAKASAGAVKRFAFRIDLAGTARLPVRLVGKTKRRLLASGRVRLGLSVSFTPDYGSAGQRTIGLVVKVRRT